MKAGPVSYRERVLREVAERYGELVDPLQSGSGVRGTGELGLAMPRTYTATVREFERLAVELRSVDPGLHWHLLEWFLKAERVIRHEPVWVTTASGKRRRMRGPGGFYVTRAMVGFRRHPGAVAELAFRAIGWIAEEWGLPVEPESPWLAAENRGHRDAVFA